MSHRIYSMEEMEYLQTLLAEQDFHAPSLSVPSFMVNHGINPIVIKLTTRDLYKLVLFLQERGILDTTLELVALTSELEKVGTRWNPNCVTWTYATQTNPKDWKKYTSMRLWLNSRGFSIY